MKYINYNGQIIAADTAIFTAENRAFRYGDALFESIRMFDGRLPFLAYHYERLAKGMEVLGYDISTDFDVLFFENEIKKLIQSEGQHEQNYRIRLTVYRTDGGLYTPESDAPIFIIEHEEMTDNQFVINKKGLNIAFCESVKLPISPLANLKTANALPYVLAARFCQKNKLDDCILFNEAGRVGETFKANIFFAKNDTIYTPSLTEGCIDGVMRRVVIGILKDLKKEVIETQISVKDLSGFQGVFITNATRGVQWVSRIFEIKTYEKSLVDEITERLNELKR